MNNWPQATARERELRFKWESAMDRGLGNTIMFATAFDKPVLPVIVYYCEKTGQQNSLGIRQINKHQHEM